MCSTIVDIPITCGRHKLEHNKLENLANKEKDAQKYKKDEKKDVEEEEDIMKKMRKGEGRGG